MTRFPDIDAFAGRHQIGCAQFDPRKAEDLIHEAEIQLARARHPLETN
jgi:hypothetical protein